jgi:hypothetical protein
MPSILGFQKSFLYIKKIVGMDEGFFFFFLNYIFLILICCDIKKI